MSSLSLAGQALSFQERKETRVASPLRKGDERVWPARLVFKFTSVARSLQLVMGSIATILLFLMHVRLGNLGMRLSITFCCEPA